MDVFEQLRAANEGTWFLLGQFAESLNDNEKALYSYENALRFNKHNTRALTQIACIHRLQGNYTKAAEYFKRILNIENNGEVWGALGHCYLMTDNLQKAYTAYQQALYYLPNPTDPNLWYGIGILYDRYGSFEHSEEAFSAVLLMDANFEKANEIYFRLGISFKQQKKYDQALSCFQKILHKPPAPLISADIYFQIGHVHELKKEREEAKEAYERVLKDIPKHAKALQQLGWLYYLGAPTPDIDTAIQLLQKSLEADSSEAQTHYLLGRCFMSQQSYKKAYDAYQEAVYRDGQNPIFWCSIGILYYQINQYRDALDAYSRAIRLSPYLPEVWYDLGILYESCHQPKDSVDAYERALDLDPSNSLTKKTLESLKDRMARGSPSRSENLKTIEPSNISTDPPAYHNTTEESRPPTSSSQQPLAPMASMKSSKANALSSPGPSTNTPAELPQTSSMPEERQLNSKNSPSPSSNIPSPKNNINHIKDSALDQNNREKENEKQTVAQLSHKENSPVNSRENSPINKETSPTNNRENSPVNKENSSDSRESSPVNKENSSNSRESSPVNKENPSANRESSAVNKVEENNPSTKENASSSSNLSSANNSENSSHQPKTEYESEKDQSVKKLKVEHSDSDHSQDSESPAEKEKDFPQSKPRPSDSIESGPPPLSENSSSEDTPEEVSTSNQPKPSDPEICNE